jgi:hypothetical protein
METYIALMSAIEILTTARVNVGLGLNNPAWTMLFHASQYIEKQANSVMRGEVA